MKIDIVPMGTIDRSKFEMIAPGVLYNWETGETAVSDQDKSAFVLHDGETDKAVLQMRRGIWAQLRQ